MAKSTDRSNSPSAEKERGLNLDTDYSSSDDVIEDELAWGNNLQEMDNPIHPARV
jgi:hypothetical protein